MKTFLAGVGALVVLGALTILVFPRGNQHNVAALVPRATESSPQFRIALFGHSPVMKTVFEGFRAKMEELLGSNAEYLEIDIPFTAQNIQNGAEYILEEKANFVVTGQSEATLLHNRITKIPVLVVPAMTPVELGFAAAKSGSDTNFMYIDAGNHLANPERLRLFKEFFPEARRILVMRGSTSLPGELEISYQYLKKEADALGIELVDKQFTTKEELNKFILSYDWNYVDAVWRNPGPFMATYVSMLLSLREYVKKPIVVISKEELVRGGTIAYGPDYFELGVRAAVIAAQVFSGKSIPGRVPIGENNTFLFGINEEAIRELGMHTPPSLKEKADYLIPLR